ncbi:MAG: hydroxypyruvate isomerase, partial [Bacilli bacterium]|nr:hydroxypyruvate isomerase [Bacilli bacterium]
MKYSLCIGAYKGQDIFYHLEKIKEHGLHGLEYYSWWNLNDLNQVAREQERLGVGIIATCTKFFNLVEESKREQYLEALQETIAACKLLGIKSIITQTGNEIEGVPREVQMSA